jgi:hypothetical protein
MRVILFILCLFAHLGIARGEGSPGARFDLHVNLADQREVHRELTLPEGGSQRLKIDDDLFLELKPWKGFGGRWFEAVVIRSAGGVDRGQSVMQRPVNDGPDVLALAFSICGDRIIAVANAKPGRCADLPSMAVPDRVFGACGAYCTGPYEGMPAVITAHERIAPASEPGDPLTVTGRVLGADGRPRSGILVYGYQTDRNGVYPEVQPPRSYVSNYQGRLRGWARTDDRGRYRFDTIRPASYGGNPQHIHMQVVEPGCSTYRIDDLMFAGDPLLERLTPEQRLGETPGVGGPGVGTLRRKGRGWEVTRDIHLGLKVPAYETCSAAK